jgi:hypothetical protein
MHVMLAASLPQLIMHSTSAASASGPDPHSRGVEREEDISRLPVPEVIGPDVLDQERV